MRRPLCAPLLLALALLLGACDRQDRYDRPGTPVPESLWAETLEGERIDRAALLGRPGSSTCGPQADTPALGSCPSSKP